MSIEYLYNFIDSYLLSSKENSRQINNLKRILYVNPLVIYENEEQWRQNQDKLKILTKYNQTRTALGYTITYIGFIHLIGLVNFRVSRQQYSLRKAWANYICRNTFWIPGVSYLTYTNYILDRSTIFHDEIQKMLALPQEQSYLYSEQYVKEKYFKKLNDKFHGLWEDSYLIANGQKAVEEKDGNEEEQNVSSSRNIKQQQYQQSENQPKQKQAATASSSAAALNLNQKQQQIRTDDYYFEIAEIIEELDEESFFD